MTANNLMQRPPCGPGSPTGFALTASAAAHGLFHLTPETLAANRRRPSTVPEAGDRVPPSLLRYSDEQTVAGVGAVFAASSRFGLEPGSFEDWGIIAAPRFLGRASLAQALRTFLAEGVWGTSPHLIPHFALHSISGTISLALGAHGPNLGVGGGLHSPAEGFLTALTWLATGLVPGVWLVVSGWTPELVPGRTGGVLSNSECTALALALVADASPADRPRFRVVRGAERHAPLELLDLRDLAGCLEPAPGASPRTIATDQQGWLRVELIPACARETRMNHNGHA